MKEVTINCEQMDEGWNYETCPLCKRFTINSTANGLNWSCSLNKASANEKKAFYTIWAENYLVSRGIEIRESTIKVEYVGKRKKSV